MSYKDPEKAREQKRRYYQENKNTKKYQEQRSQYLQENREKIQEYMQQYYQENRKEIKEKRKRYSQENPEKQREQRKRTYQKRKNNGKDREQRIRYRQEHKEKLQEYRKRYRQEHKEEIQEKAKQYRQEHKEEIQEKAKQYRQTLIGKTSAAQRQHERRARLKNCQVNDLTKAQVKLVLAKAKKCRICGRKFSEKLTRTLDHIQPMSREGYNTLTNIQIVCLGCNIRKKNKEYTLYTNGQLLMFTGKKELLHQET